MSMNLLTRIVTADRSAVIFSGQSLEKGCDLVSLSSCELYSTLIQAHIADSFFQGLTGTIVIIWPCMLHIAESRNLETMTVTLLLSLLETSVVLISELETTLCKVMTSEAHQLI